MDWTKVIEELRRLADAQEAVVRNPANHQLVQVAGTVTGSVFKGLAAALEKGMKGVN